MLMRFDGDGGGCNCGRGQLGALMAFRGAGRGVPCAGWAYSPRRVND